MKEQKDAFELLLKKEEPEQSYQEFLEKNTQFIPREFIQNHGIHFNLVIRKIALGREYTTDFFYLSKSSDNWHGIFIEIEKPYSRFFRDKTNDFHPDFLQALQQINKWRAWLSENANLDQFCKTTIGSIKQPLGENPLYPKFVLVFGRREEYATSALRKSLIRAQEREDFRIMSYDSLLEDLNNKQELYVGVRKNEHVEIVSDNFVQDNIFRFSEPHQLKISKFLKEKIISDFKVNDFEKGSLDEKLFENYEKPYQEKIYKINTID
jgi:hypothetical protein